MGVNKEYEQKCYSGNHPRILVTQEFVNRNKLQLTTDFEEIFRRARKSKEEIFCNKIEVLYHYLPFNLVKEFLEKEIVEEIESGKRVWTQITDIYETVQDFLDYMVFGWMKALESRSLSASRTIAKLSAWLFLLGREDLSTTIERSDLYAWYGIPALIKICEELGIEVPQDLISAQEEYVKNE